jgi:glycosyltransferase involved in cell wall biosynthesis
MNCLIFSGNSSDKHFVPISKSNSIKKITIIRDEQGFKDSKINYIIPKKKGLLKTIERIFLSYKILRKEKVNFIHSFYMIPHGIIALFTSKLFNKKVGLSLIGTDLDIHIKKKWYGSFLLFFLKKFDIVTVTGSKSKKYLEEKGIKAKVLPHCVDLTEFKQKKNAKKDYDLLFVGRLSSEKRIDRILKVINELKIDDNKIKLGIIGNGPEEIKLKNQIKKERLEKNVIYLGYKNNVVPYYQKTKLLILMSAREGSPVVLPEAMACGIVPIVMNVGDIGDIVNNNNGLIYDVFNEKKIAKDIINILNNKKEYSKKQKEAQKIKESKNIESGAKFWENLLKNDKR